MAKFSKQHYQVIANQLRGLYSLFDFGRPEAEPPNQRWDRWAAMSAANLLANIFDQDNKRFNREHFLAVVRGERPVNSRPPKKAPMHSRACVEVNDHRARYECICEK